jgi:integrase
MIAKAQKLTDKLVREFPAPATGYDLYPDVEVKGLWARVTAGGSRSFVLNYRNAQRRERRLTIGQHPSWTVRQARNEAANLKRDIDRGRDPVAERKEARAAGVMVAELADRYVGEHARSKKKASSAVEDERNIRNHIKPTLGGLGVAAVSSGDIARLHHRMRQWPTGANRVLALLSKMFSLAETWKLRPQHSNPCRGIDKYPETKRERLISAEEMARLGEALAAHKGYWAGPAAIRLMALTGMRKGEALTLRWEDIDAALGVIRLSDSKTGQKLVPLGAPALTLLSELPRVEGNPFVFPAARLRHAKDAGKPSHFVQVQTTWEAVIKAAGVANLRPHDLRHGFASAGAMGGDSLYVIGKLLGHADSKTTQRYAHLSSDPLQAVADRISGRVAAALDGKAAKVVKTGR